MHPDQDPLVAQIRLTVERYGMLDRGDKVLVGVSGGPDSTALLHLLYALGSIYDLTLGVAHLDHGLRPEAAEQERSLVCSLAQRLNIPCHADRVTVTNGRGSLEERLRHHRYAFYERLAAAHGYTRIALGHHAEDNAEAVLLHLLRGSGLRGLAGIPPVRDGWIIRPLIHTRREAILAYLARHQLSFAQDASNADLRFQRNRIRHQLMPMLRNHYNRAIVQTLNRTARLCREEEQWLGACLNPHLARIIKVNRPALLELDIHALCGLPRPAQRRLIRACLERWQGHLRRLGADHVEALLDLAAGVSGRFLDLPGTTLVECASPVLRFTRAIAARGAARSIPAHSYCYRVALPAEMPFGVEIPEARCRLVFSAMAAGDLNEIKADEKVSILLDMDQVRFPLSLRNRQPGDRLQPFGMAGTQKVKTLMINRKVPVHLRDRLPILVAGHAILWVVGLRRSNIAVIAPATRRVLRVTLEPF